jgi:predicted regulator of Ras-like GTPase activity (Roadblock/LC7/MglB family)
MRRVARVSIIARNRSGRRLKRPARLEIPDKEVVLDFQEVLINLLATVRGASGALLIQADGEAVVWRSRGDPDQLRLRGAYVAVVLRASEALAKSLALGAIEYFFLKYQGAGFLARAVGGGGYFLVVEMDSSANVSEVNYRINPFVERLREEIEK